MAFVSKDWRDPGGIYVKSEVGRWMSTKTCRLRIFEMLNEKYLKRAFCQSLSEYENENYQTQINEVFKDTPSGFYQPHIIMKSISTKESVMVTSLIETLLALDFKVAIRDIRRLGYVCRVLHIFIKELFSNLSGQIQIYIMDLLKEVLQEVLKSKNYVNVVRMLLFQLQSTLENNRYNHVGSFHLWCNHLKCLEEMKLSLSKITFSQTRQSNDFKFENLPIECILKILQHLTSPHDFEMLGQTCLTLQYLVNDKMLWKSLVEHHFSEIQISSVISKISINASDKSVWFFIYTRLLNKFGDSHFFPTKLAKCNSCSSIFWPIFGHPCLSKANINHNYILLSPDVKAAIKSKLTDQKTPAKVEIKSKEPEQPAQPKVEERSKPLSKPAFKRASEESPVTVTMPSVSKPEVNATQSVHNLNNASDSSSHAPQFSVSFEEWTKLMDDMRKIKIILKGHDKRIQQLEESLKATHGGSGAHSSAPKSSQ